jgi:hypothetical protein
MACLFNGIALGGMIADIAAREPLSGIRPVDADFFRAARSLCFEIEKWLVLCAIRATPTVY